MWIQLLSSSSINCSRNATPLQYRYAVVQCEREHPAEARSWNRMWPWDAVRAASAYCSIEVLTLCDSVSVCFSASARRQTSLYIYMPDWIALERGYRRHSIVSFRYIHMPDSIARTKFAKWEHCLQYSACRSDYSRLIRLPLNWHPGNSIDRKSIVLFFGLYRDRNRDQTYSPWRWTFLFSKMPPMPR